MQTEELVNQLKAVLPRYTGDFTANTTITSLTRSGSTATATTNVAHQLKVGNKVLINGAKVPVVISSLTRNGNYALAITASDHPLIRGNITVELSGANETAYNGVKTLLVDKNNFLSAPSIEVESITISGSTATVTTKTPHGYINNPNIQVSITGAYPDVYNKQTLLNSVPTSTTFTYIVYGTENNATTELGNIIKVKQLINSRTFIFEVSDNPTTPATGTITQLSSYKAGYNGYKTILTTPTSTTFTYACDSNLGTPAQGSISSRSNPTITGSVDYERAVQMFQSGNEFGQPVNWAVLILGDETTSKNQSTKTDGISTYQTGNNIRENSYQNITLFIFIPCGSTNDQLLYAKTRDVATSYKPIIFKALLGFRPTSNLSDTRYSGLVSVSNGVFQFNSSYYVHQYTFQASCWLNQDDTIDADDAFAFREFDFDVLNTDFNQSVMSIEGDVDQEN